MACERIRKRLMPFIDGELGLEEAAWIQDHLNSCMECRAECDELQGVWDLLNTYPEALIPQGFANRVVARAEDSGKRRTWLLPGLWRWRAMPLGWATALVFIAGLALGGGIFQVWSDRVHQTVEAYWTEQEPYLLEAFHDIGPRSLTEGYWNMIATDTNEDMP